MNRDERREAKRDGAKPIPNSGRGNLKGDAALYYENVTCLVDYKHFTSSFTVNHAKWTKHSKDAFEQGYDTGIYSVVLERPDGRLVKVGVIDWDWLTELLENYSGTV